MAKGIKVRRKGFFTVLLWFFIVTLVVTVVGAVRFSTITTGIYQADALAASAADTMGMPSSFADLAERLKPAVVNISTTKTVTSGGMGSLESPFRGSPFDKFFGGDEFFRRFFGDIPERQFKERSLGSGFIISKEGYIFTNNHVVEQADKILVKLSNGKEYVAEIKGTDEKTDIALIKIDAKNDLPVATLGDSSKIRVGDWVVAIGNPFGLEQTVTAGIVSAKGRVIGAGPYDDFIQTDASINPGNSGGPLFNLKGEVVGINTAIIARGQGIGFAIPIDMATKIMEQLKDKGKVVRGWLGVSVQDITDDIAKQLDIKTKEGALIADVFKGDPADKAGIKTGDVITEVDGQAIKNTHELLKIVAGVEVGKDVKIKLLRNGDQKTLTVTVTERPEKRTTAGISQGKDYFGMTVQEITPEMADHLGLKDVQGVIVTGVKAGSPADEAQVKGEDIILQVNRTRVSSLQEYLRIMSQIEKDDSVLLLIRRGEVKFFTVIRKQ
ncbi:MAG: DegQ family serine endoprotease [Deltaproteobacteria bacterium]|nr:DegQ family serine endoprotease [Deltaproteobacteria bacterium]